MSSTATRKFAHMTYAWERATNNVGKGGGSADRKQKQYYAGMVTQALTGIPFWVNENGKWCGQCPLTGMTFELEFSEVDKVDAPKGYHPGNVALVSKRGNQERRTFQQAGNDILGYARYAADVTKASAGIAIPRKCDAAPIVNSWGRTMNGGAVENGPYGKA